MRTHRLCTAVSNRLAANRHFQCPDRLQCRVVALDQSLQQLQNARQHTKVSYQHANAESTGLPDSSMDLVTSATGLHWYACSPSHSDQQYSSQYVSLTLAC